MNAKDESAEMPRAAGHPSDPGNLSRREVSRRLLGVAAILHLDALHPVWTHLPLHPAVQDAANSAGTNQRPILLTMDQMADFAGIAEGIVPGSTKALVASFVDLLLSVDRPEVQQGFCRSLAVLQQEAKHRFGTTLAALTTSQRDEILAAVSTAREGRPEHAAFEDLKTWVVGAYYSSEIGMTELGWTPSRFFDSLPDCSHADESE
jgi:Gluconate 2-dehydrogenase subunit 3